jgi:thiol-disulfide isomerase/thioredoxin
MRRLLGAIVAVLLLSAVAACKVTPQSDVAPDPSIAQIKSQAGMKDCPGPQVAHGGLPDVTLPCLGAGTPVHLASLKGPLIINLWQKQCPPCQLEMPALEAFYQHYGARYPVLGIDSQDYAAKVAVQIAAHRGVTYPLALDPYLHSELQGTSLSVHSYPVTYLLTAAGEVKVVNVGGMTSEAVVIADVEKAVGHTL